MMGAPLSGPITVDDRPIYLLANSREALARALDVDRNSLEAGS